MMRFSVQIGYYFSAFTVDKPWMGRVRLQSMVSRKPPILSLGACLTDLCAVLLCQCGLQVMSNAWPCRVS